MTPTRPPSYRAKTISSASKENAPTPTRMSGGKGPTPKTQLLTRRRGVMYMTTVQLRQALREADIAFEETESKTALAAKLQGGLTAKVAIEKQQGPSPARTPLGAVPSERVKSLAHRQGFGAFQAPM